MSQDVALFMEFCELREAIIEEIKAIAVFSEEKNGKTVRPIGVIKTNAEYFKFEKYLARWRELVNQLNEINPVRYPLNAEKFSLMPQLYTGVESFSVYISPATLSRKYEKAKIVSRMEKYIDSLSHDSRNTGDWTITNRVKHELEVMNKDKETYYRLRNTCSTDMTCVLTYENGLTDKVKIPFCGALLFNNERLIDLKPTKKLNTRTDSFDYLGVNPIACSLSLAGNLYRESEIIKARERRAMSK